MPAPSSASSSAAERRKQRSKRCECGGLFEAAQVRIGCVAVIDALDADHRLVPRLAGVIAMPLAERSFERRFGR